MRRIVGVLVSAAVAAGIALAPVPAHAEDTPTPEPTPEIVQPVKDPVQEPAAQPVQPQIKLVPSRGCNFRGSVKPAPVKTWARSYKHADTWLYGDSITWQSYHNLLPQLRGRVAVDAYWGRNTHNAAQALLGDLRANRKRKDRPKVVIMAVGTNDLRDLNAFRTEVRRIRHMVPKRIKIIWVNVYSENNPDYARANRVIASVPGLRVVSWSATNVRRTSDTQFLYDGTHVTVAGCLARNRAIRDAVRRVR